MAKTKTPTPLMSLLRACKDDAEREAFAKEARTTVNYLYALAGCHRGSEQGPRSVLALAIEDASVKFHKETQGRIPVVTVRELATMCAIAGLDA